jgi:hypothetical protein
MPTRAKYFRTSPDIITEEKACKGMRLMHLPGTPFLLLMENLNFHENRAGKAEAYKKYCEKICVSQLNR